MAIHPFEPPRNPNELTWEDVVEMGLDAVRPEHLDEIELGENEELVIGETGLAIITVERDSRPIGSRSYGPPPAATILPFRPRG